MGTSFFRAGEAPAAPDIGRLEGKKRPVTLASAAFIVLIISALLGLEAWSRVTAYDAQLRQSTIAVANIANASAEHIESTFELVGTVLGGLVEGAQREDLDGRSTERLRSFMVFRVRHTPVLARLHVFDSQGRPLAGSDRSGAALAASALADSFPHHRDHRDPAAYVGAPVAPGAPGELEVPVSRRLEFDDGAFAGIAVAYVRVQHFQRYFREFELGANGAMLLLRADGLHITSRPHPDGSADARAQGAAVLQLLGGAHAATAMRVAASDGIERLYAVHRVKDHPFIVAAALSKQETFRQWWTTTFKEAGALALLLATVLALGYRLYRQFVVRDRLEQELRSMQAALRASCDELDQLAKTDALTGLFNRRYLNEQLEVEFKRAARAGTPVAVILFDVDHFKKYNDLYGHVAGDACLRLVGGVLRAAAGRAGDLAARYGGEEFAIMLPATTTEGALAVAGAICHAVAALHHAHAGSDSGELSVSAGVFAAVPQGPRDIHAVLEAADRALYAAKAGGRNRACAAEPSRA